MNILLVEDSATLRFAMESYIRQAGHTPLIAENGEKAVQMVDDGSIDMILMDVEMPGLNGFETTRLIRENLQDNWIPIIFVTGKSEEASFEQGIAVGGDDYLIKPVSKVILQAKIRAMERIANMRSQLHQLNEELKRLSQHDGLTQLLNRRGFDTRAIEAWRTASRAKQPLGVILFDIDYFKKYNDSYGHQAGDECIKLVADAARECCHRPTDIVARYGGEEFVVLLPDTNLQGTQHVAETLRRSIESKNFEHQGSPDYGKVTVSVGGCAIKHTTGANLEELISAADAALYKCKELGRNRAQVTEFKNLHNVLYIDYSSDETETLTQLLDEHCQLKLIDSDSSLSKAMNSASPELVILSVEGANDPSISAYKKLRDKLHLTIVPLLLLSPLKDRDIKQLGKALAANGSISVPLDPHRTLAKIDQYIATQSFGD